MTDVTFSAQIIPDKFHDFKVNKDARVSDVIKQVLRSVSGQGKATNISEYRVLVTYQLAVADTPIDQLSSEQATISGDDSLLDIKFQDGFSILFVKPIVVSTKLELWIDNKKVDTIDRHETMIGRPDPDHNITPDFDLTPYLGDFERKVSRKQAFLREEDGRWMIRLADEAQSNIFLNGQRLERGSTYEITHESAILFGPNIEQPYLRIIARLSSD